MTHQGPSLSINAPTNTLQYKTTGRHVVPCRPEVSTIDRSDYARLDEYASTPRVGELLSAPRRDQPKVLHVDDEPDFVEMAAIFLERSDHDFAVATETDPQAALERLQREEFHCIISDYQMPEMTGLELLRAIREDYPDLPVILCTARGSEEVASEAIVNGVTDYIQKGTDTKQYEILANRVQNAIEQYRTRQQLWDMLSWSAAVMDQDIVGVVVVQDGVILHANERFATLVGGEVSDLIDSGVDTLEVETEAGEPLTAETFAVSTSAQFTCRPTTEGATDEQLKMELTDVRSAGDRAAFGIVKGLKDEVNTND